MVAQPYDSQDVKRRAYDFDLQAFHLEEVGTGRRSGKALIDRVPWRDDRKPSLAVYINGWKDWATGDTGDIFSYVMNLRNMTYAQALEYIAGRVGGNLAPRKPPARPAQQRSDPSTPPSAVWQRETRAIADDGQHRLWLHEGQRALDYLRQRGLADDTIRRAQLGYISAARMKELFPRLSRSAAISIPWQLGPDLWALKFRRLDPGPDEPKYIQIGGGNQAGALYGADFIRADKPIIFTEGEFDALVGQQLAGEIAAFVTLGSATNRLAQRWQLLVEAAFPLISIRDNDGAGQVNADKNTARLPDHRWVITVPTGKDLTEFALTGADVQAWITNLLANPPKLQLTQVSDGLRSAALNCKLDAALITYEVAVLSGARPGQPIELTTLYETNQRLALGIGEDYLRDGTAQGAGIFWAKSGSDLTDQGIKEGEPPNPELARKSTGRPSKPLTLLPTSAIKANLRALAPWRLLERMYPRWDESFPEQKVTALVQAIDGLAETEQGQLIDELITYCRKQVSNEIQSRRRWKAYASALRTLLRMLDDPHSTPLPPGWTNGRQYRAIYFHELVEADPTTRRGYDDIALITGVNPSNVKPLLDRAALENHADPEIIALPERTNIAAAAFAAARGQGKIYEIALLDEQDRVIEQLPYNPSDPDNCTDVQAWADRAPSSAKIAVKVRVKGRQTVLGPVQPPAPRKARPPTPGSVVASEPTKTTPAAESPQRPAAPERRKLRPAYTGPGPDPVRLRDLLLDVYQQKNDVTLAQAMRDSLSVLDAARMVLLQSTEEGEMFITLSQPAEREDMLDQVAAPPQDELPGAALYQTWLAFNDRGQRDDWYLTLDHSQRWQLIDYKAQMHRRQKSGNSKDPAAAFQVLDQRGV